MSLFPPPPPKSDDDDLSAGVIAGIAIGCVVALIVCAGGAYYFLTKYKKPVKAKEVTLPAP